MHIRRLNRPLFAFEPEHPARRFLEAFIACLETCLGRERDGIDQQWTSASDGRRHSFSSFAYTELAFDVQLDGWLTEAGHVTDCEKATLNNIPRLTTLMRECKAAAMAENNSCVVAMCDEVLEVLGL